MNAPQPTGVIISTIDDALKQIATTQDGAAALRVAFAPHFQAVHELAEQARMVKADEPKKARAIRLLLKAARVAADKTREDEKAESLRRGKAVQGIYNVLEYQVIPLEEGLERIEKAEEIREAERKAALQRDRAEELRPFLDPEHMALGEMGTEAYSLLLAGAKAAHQAKIDAAAKELAERTERERIAKEELARKLEADRVERERMQAENARLAKVADEERAKRQAQEATAAKERAEAAKAQKDKDDAAAAARKKADEAANQERQRLAAAAEAEKRKAEIAQAEVRRLEQEKADQVKADQAAKKKAARAPEKAKVASLAVQVRALHLPDLKSEEGAALAAKIKEQMTKLAHWLDVEGAKL